MAEQEEEPQLLVLAAFHETSPSSCSVVSLDGLSGDPVVGENSLLFSKPSGVVWLIRKNKAARNGYDECEDALEDERPSPAAEIGNPTHLEDTDRDQAGEGRSTDVRRKKDCNSCCNLLSGVEDLSHLEIQLWARVDR